MSHATQCCVPGSYGTASLCQCPEAERLAVGDSSGTSSSAASCDGQFSCPYNCQHPVVLCSEGWAWGRQKTDRASQEMALCSHSGSSDNLLPLGAPSSSPTKLQSTWLTPSVGLHPSCSSSTSSPKRCWPFLLHPVSACDQEPQHGQAATHPSPP